MPKVSVIVPVYNVAPYLARCLDSLINQTLQDIEIICIDDKSTDISLEILREYEKKDKRVHVIALDKNSGVATARNTGIDAASGEYLGFVDPDDYVDLDFYEKLYKSAKDNIADISHANCRITNFNNYTYIAEKELRLIQENSKWYFIWQWWCGLYKRQMICENNIRFPVDIISGQDNVFLKECINYANNISLCFDTYYNYIRREGSLSEQIMPPYKITSRLNAFRLTSNIYNSASYDNPDDYAFCFEDLVLRTYEHFAKNTSIECKIDVCTMIIELYKKCKDKTRLIKRLSMDWPISALAYIQSYDSKGLYEHFLAQESAAQSVVNIPASKYNILLFGTLPVAQMIKSQNTLTIRLFGLQIFKLKNANKNIRINILYIPLIRMKIK